MPFSILNTTLALGIVSTGGAAGHTAHADQLHQDCPHQTNAKQQHHNHKAHAPQKFNQKQTNQRAVQKSVPTANQNTNTQATAPTAQTTQKTATTQTTAQSPSGITAPNASLKMVAQRESGGDITAINPTSGAAGKY